MWILFGCTVHTHTLYLFHVPFIVSGWLEKLEFIEEILTGTESEFKAGFTKRFLVPKTHVLGIKTHLKFPIVFYGNTLHLGTWCVIWHIVWCVTRVHVYHLCLSACFTRVIYNGESMDNNTQQNSVKNTCRLCVFLSFVFMQLFFCMLFRV